MSALGLGSQLLGDLRLDFFAVRAAVVLGDLLPEPGDRLFGRLRRGLPELVTRSQGLRLVHYGLDSPRLPVTARTIATISAARRTKKMTDRIVAISTTGVPAGWAKMPRNGATSGSVIP